MASARAALRSGALGAQGLGALLTHTNNVLAASNRHHRFMTLSLLEIDGNSGRVTWASAGHDAPIVFDPGAGEFRELEGGDLPLGVTEGVEYAEYSGAAVLPGGVLVIGTDGVWEMVNGRQEQYGKERLRAVIRRHHARSAAGIAAALDEDLTAFRGTCAPEDDVTFVIIKFLQEVAPPARGAVPGSASTPAEADADRASPAT
jgi:sigma-B regulation protein RsbU (phosphoserine phosphatase)